MAKSIQEILGGRNMTGVIKTVQSGLPNFIPPSFFNVTKRITGNKSSYLKVQGAREHAQSVMYGSPAREVARKNMAEVGVTLIHTFEQQSHDPLILQNLLGTNGEPAQNFAIQEIDRQTLDFKKRFDNLRINAVASVLSNGKIFLDGSGTLVFSSGSAVNTIDYSVPATNLNQADTTITVPWSSSTADIIGNLTTIKKMQILNGRAPLTEAFYGVNLPKYIAGNTAAAGLIQASPALAQQFYNTGEIPNGFCGLNWHPVYNQYGMSGTTATTWFGADALTLTPSPNSDWWGMQEGSYMVPRDVGSVYSDAVAAGQSLDQVSGMFSYGIVGHNPPGITQYAGDTFLPILGDGSAIFILDVTP